MSMFAAEELKKFLHTKFVPQLPECLREATKHAIEEGHLRSMPNQFMSARPRLVPGAVLIGDSFNMRHPFTGGGMTCGLADAVRLRDMLAKVPVGDAGWTDVRALTKVVAAFYANRQHNVAINMLSQALFDVCSGDKPELRQACFDYLSLGPTYFNGPITLLSGRARSQALLARNFTMVALFGVFRTAFLPFPTPYKLWSALKMTRQAVPICLFGVSLSFGAGIDCMFFTIFYQVAIFAPLVASERAALPLQILCRVLRVLFLC
jgi:squalene monooxygenase